MVKQMSTGPEVLDCRSSDKICALDNTRGILQNMVNLFDRTRHHTNVRTISPVFASAIGNQSEASPPKRFHHCVQSGRLRTQKSPCWRNHNGTHLDTHPQAWAWLLLLQPGDWLAAVHGLKTCQDSSESDNAANDQ